MTTHLTEDDLVLLYYGEEDAPEGARGHLETCPDCRRAAEELARDLDQVTPDAAPERPAGYEQWVWARVRREIAASAVAAPRTSGARRWAVAAAAVVAAFLLGRHLPQDVGLAPRPIPEPVRERILLVAVGEHLERSRLVLVELSNAEGGEADLSSEQEQAQGLVGANRLYRMSAEQAGETGVANVLEELERVLVELAHGPSQRTSGELERLQKRIEARGLLFKVKVLETQVKEREKRSIGHRDAVS